MTAAACLVIFAKAPVAGEVNTRLIPGIGVEAATALQQDLIDIRMQQFGAATDIDVQLWCSPDTRHHSFQHCLETHDISLYTQQGADLGERIVHALGKTFARYERVALIGTDAPALGADDVGRALDQLDTHDVVTVPAEDGGYVLIAMRAFYKDVFLSVPWGTSDVLRKTRANVQAQALKYKELETSWDIDRLVDYQRYMKIFRA